MDRRTLIRQIVSGYENVRLREQEADGSVVIEARESQSRLPVLIRIFPMLLGSDPEIADRFRRLAEAIRQLNHPTIVEGQLAEESGLPYAVREALQKLHPLAQRLDQPWAVDAVANLAESVGQALEHAYQRGIVHGDLNPDNILLDEAGQVRVSELGLAQLGELMGSSVRDSMSPYLAPERVAGRPANPASDVYSLGVIVYALLARRLPERQAGELLPVSRFNRQVSPALDAVLARALAENPDDRYTSVGDFLHAMQGAAVRTKPEPEAAQEGVRCPNCGGPNQTGRYCRSCGTQLRPARRPKARQAPVTGRPASKLDEPIQQTRIRIGTGARVLQPIETTRVEFDSPVTVAGDEISADFPEPLPMPRLELEDLWPETKGQPPIVMPKFLPMPDVDWETLVPPLPEVPKLDGVEVIEDEEETAA
jgi:hypothetical protein